MSISTLSQHTQNSHQGFQASNRLYQKFCQLRTFALPLIIVSFFLTGCSAESAPARWQPIQAGVYGHYTASLDCETLPDTGAFQRCDVVFTAVSGDAVELQLIQIEGGMPAHGHGLPTSPTLHLTDKPNTYRIDGLKYNMPGAWLLGFQVSGEYGEDQIVFDFVI